MTVWGSGRKLYLSSLLEKRSPLLNTFSQFNEMITNQGAFALEHRMTLERLIEGLVLRQKVECLQTREFIATLRLGVQETQW